MKVFVGGILMLGECGKHHCLLEYDPLSGYIICPQCKYDNEWIKAEYDTLVWNKPKHEEAQK